jgi:hypothetical protein
VALVGVKHGDQNVEMSKQVFERGVGIDHVAGKIKPLTLTSDLR